MYIRLAILIFLFTSQVYARDEVIKSTIATNQVGYVTSWSKNALLINSPSPNEVVELVNDATDEVIFIIKPTKPRIAQEGVTVQWIDFTEIKQSGRYFLKQNDLRSNTFVIEVFPYKTLNDLALRSYYLQRCGIKVEDSSGLNHEACHLEDGVVARTDVINKRDTRFFASGGWHDAGDYGKYIAPASATVNRLLSLYENNPELFEDNQLNIPESGNGIPDILDEVKVELEWMQSMQRQDGAVYRKLAGDHWPKSESPDLDDQARYVYGVSSPETAKFATSLGMASRVYEKIDPQSSLRYLKSSERAWRWLEENTEQMVDAQPDDDKGSGKYLFSKTDTEKSLTTDVDDRLSAAIELYLTTNKNEYLSYIIENAYSLNYTLFEWKDISALSLYHLMQKDKSAELKSIRKEIRSKLLTRARLLLNTTNENAYGLANTKFIWGSNKMTAEEGITLVNAYVLTKDKEYLKAAVGQLDYLLGRNALSISFVSGVGANPVRYPNHLYARGIKARISGFMVGGPNSLGQDNITPKSLGALSYVDNDHAYASNEYAIDYNSALIGLIVNLMTVSDMPNVSQTKMEE